MKYKSCFLSMTMRDIYISLQKLSKVDLKTENCKILLFSFGCVLIVAMTTICLNLQSVSLLGHNIQKLLYKNDDERYPYQSTKFAKIDFKNSKIKLFLFSCGIIVAMATRLLSLQGVLFLNHNIQWLLLKYDDDKYLYLSTKVAKIDLKH